GLRRCVSRSPLRAGLLTGPVPVLMLLFACLVVCLLATVVFPLDHIAPVAMLAPPQARRSAPGGQRPRKGRQHRQQCLPCEGSRAGCEAKRFSLAASPADPCNKVHCD